MGVLWLFFRVMKGSSGWTVFVQLGVLSHAKALLVDGEISSEC